MEDKDFFKLRNQRCPNHSFFDKGKLKLKFFSNGKGILGWVWICTICDKEDFINSIHY
jgi:hypothetical protein